MSLTVEGVFARVRRTFGDESAVQVTEDDIIRWINDAQREAAMQNENLLQTTMFVDSVVNQYRYALDPSIFVVHQAYFRNSFSQAYFHLRWRSMHDLNRLMDGWDGTLYSEAFPQVFATEEQDLIIFPAPGEAAVEGIKLNVSRYPIEVENSSDELDLPPYLHTMVVNFCLMQAYEMDEDWEASQLKATQVQGDLNFNNNREFWFGRDTYPVIGLSEEW